jgi:hypothetical protein
MSDPETRTAVVPMLAAVAGVLLLSAAGIFFAEPWIAMGCAAAAFCCGILVRRSGLSGASDRLILCRVVLLGGGGMTLLVTLVTAETLVGKAVMMLATLPTFFMYHMGFLGFIFAYVFVCFVIFVVLLMSQQDRKPLE